MIKSSNIKRCLKCDFEVKDFMIMKRHMIDVHDVITGSTSPPPKRKRKASTEFNSSNESMETDDASIKDISIGMEDMEIDSLESEDVNGRSKLMDEKIQEKEKQREEKESMVNDK